MFAGTSRIIRRMGMMSSAMATAAIERDRRPGEEGGHDLELFRIDVAADEAGDEVADGGREEPDAHHLADEFRGASFVIDESPTGLRDSSPNVWNR